MNTTTTTTTATTGGTTGGTSGRAGSGRKPAEVLYLAEIDSPVHSLRLVASDRGLRAILWERHEMERVPFTGAELREQRTPVIEQAARQLGEYFAGERRTFDLPLDPVGSPFQRDVWRVLRAIPYGATMSYGEQARALGDVNKARAVGAANGRNPLSIVVPCHRVIGSTGKLTGFAGGLDVKAWLLDHEQGIRGLL